MILLTLTLCFTLVSHAQQAGQDRKFNFDKSHEEFGKSPWTVQNPLNRNVLSNEKPVMKIPMTGLDCKTQRAIERKNNCGVEVLSSGSSNSVLGLITAAGQSYPKLKCFNMAKPESCDQVDLKMVCGCLNSGGEKELDGANKVSSVDSGLETETELHKDSKDGESFVLNPNVLGVAVGNSIGIIFDCTKLEGKEQHECKKNQHVKIANKNVKNSVKAYAEELKKIKKDLTERSKMYERYDKCLPYPNYMMATKLFPPENVVKAIDFGSEIRNSQDSKNYQKALMSIMRGTKPIDALFQNNVNFTSELSSQLNVFYDYMTVNSQWKHLIEAKKSPSEQLEVVEKFRGIFAGSGQSPEERYAEFAKFTKTQEWIEANNKANLLNEDFNNFYQAAPDKINNDYSLINSLYGSKSGMTRPDMCENFSKAVEGERINFPEYSLSPERLQGCLSTYKDICSNMNKSENWNICERLKTNEPDSEVKVKRCLALQAEDKQQELLSSAREVTTANYNLFYAKTADYEKDAKSLCEKENKIGKESLTRASFKQILCEKNKKYRGVSQESKEKICKSSDENELTQVYAKQIGSDGNISIAVKMKGAVDNDPQAGAVNKIITTMAGEYSGKTAEQDDDDFFNALSNYANKISGKSTSFGSSNTAAANTNQSTSTFADEILSGLKDASQTLSSPKVDNNVQSFINGHIPASNILPADLANSGSEGQLTAAKASVDNGVDVLEKRLAAFERQELKSTKDSAAQVEIENLRKQIEELKSQSEQLKAQLDKEKESASKTAESKANPEAASNEGPNRSPASVDLKTNIPSVAGQTQSVAQSVVQPSKIFNDMYSDNSFHGIPTIGSSKSIDAKAFSARSSNDALLSIYTDKNVSSLVDAVAAGPSNNILVVGNALEMQESTVKEKKFQTKEIVVDQKRLEMVRSNPDILRSLIEESKIKNHEGILTLKNGENQLNYIMRKDDAGKIVILPLNIARRVTLKNLQDELKN